MSRKGTLINKRKMPPDPLFGDRRISKFINIIMTQGKKSVSERIAYGALDLIKSRIQKDEVTKGNPMVVFEQALKNVRPLLEVKSRRVGGSTYQVPVEVRMERQESLAMRWLVDAAKERGEHSMIEKLAAELMDASNKRGGAMKKKEDTHRMAEANKAFAHYRW
jgi:small subunit ribosomal protein S7